MALSPNDQHVLEEIVTTDGACLNSERCRKCPFRAMCLPEFLNPAPLSKEQRLNMALNVLSHNFLVEEDKEQLDPMEDFKWDKKS
jgi:hypothetical protein